MKIKISPSILSADFSKLGEEIKKVEPLVEMLHIDVMDGHFVPNISIGVPVVKSVRKITSKILDTHLMIQHPENYVETFANAGSDILTVHAEVVKNFDEIIEKIKSLGKKVGFAVNPATPLEKIEGILEKIDMVVIMSVDPGFGGQSFLEDALPKVTELRKIINAKKLNLDIEVDGGINLENAKRVVDAGANILVSGSTVFHSEDHAETIKKLLSIK